MTITFGGKQIRRPGAYSQTDTSQMLPISTGSFKSLAIVGEAPNIATGVNTSEVHYYASSDAKTAQQELGSGELLANMQTAWKHGADMIAVSIVFPLDEVSGVTDADWQSAVDRLDRTDVNGIIPISTEPAIQAKVDTHVQAMSDITQRKERRAFYGHPAGITASEVIALNTLDTSRGFMATPAVYDYNDAGVKTLYDSVRLASACAGVWASKEDQDPITYDSVTFLGLETNYTYTELGDLIEAGISPVEAIEGNAYRIVRGVTMNSTSDNLTEVELSVASSLDTMSQLLRENLENRHVGKAGVNGIEVTIYNDAITIIEGFKRDGLISGYVADSVQVVRNGTSFTVEWEGQPTLPMNNFFITSHFTL